MKKLFLLLGVLSISVSASAKRTLLDSELLKDIQQNGAVEDVRLYLDSKLSIERRSELLSNTDVDASVNRVLKQDILKEVVGKRVRGKITDVSGGAIFVSFNSNCHEKECSFGFRDTFGGQRYLLAKIPTIEGMEIKQVKNHVGLFSSVSLYQKYEFDSYSRNDLDYISLEVDLKELRDLNVTTIRYGGH